jgi:hypothetical protein
MHLRRTRVALPSSTPLSKVLDWISPLKAALEDGTSWVCTRCSARNLGTADLCAICSNPKPELTGSHTIA